MEKSETKKRRDIFSVFDMICKQYATNASECNLNRLLMIYEKLVPNWVRNYNALNDRVVEERESNHTVDEFLRTKLPSSYSIEDLKVGENTTKDITTDIMQRGRIIHLSNKIAHQFEYVFDSQLKGYMMKNGIKAYSEEEYRQIKRLVRRIYQEGTKEQIREGAKDMLCSQYGFEKTDLEAGKNLDALRLPELIKAYHNAMYIKSMEIEEVDRLAHHHGKKDISYGTKRDGEGKTLFVMDVTNFGQFSVHIVDPSLAAQIKREYKMPLYNRRTAMLVDYMSDKAKEFIEDSKTDDSMDEEREIPKFVSEEEKKRARLMEEIKYLDLNRAEKHELAVKGGLHREELEELDREER